MESDKIFPLPPLAAPSTGDILPPVLKSISSSWVEHDDHSTPSNHLPSTVSVPRPPTPISDAKKKTKEQPSQAHGPRKDGKKTDLKNIKPSTNLRKKPEKNIPLKITREKDPLYKPTPVSKSSRTQKTIQTLDDMDTDANLTDTDYVTDLTSEEYESLLEDDFKQLAANPLTGTLLPL
ncbi:hypothetical protein TNIN_6931 [Trichonephila inaurata madagascariensis]|uniref:Uncharacterized protein n=1 Tax=Trichonephila inaurata madagascariensis TaxID=2747483 RepID=A0A8X6WZI8_9ARAC|nr:hypothetical protein TNIN_6931 [Trichonephila inaurata madagascariensis]